MQDWTAPKLMEFSGSYWNIATLYAGVNLDVFTQIGERDISAAELSKAVNSDERGLAMLLDALVAMNLLQKHDNKYKTTPFSFSHLSKNGSDYLGYILQHHHQLMAGWTKLDKAVKSGHSVREKTSDTDNSLERESFLMGMFNIASQQAPKIVKALNLSGKLRLLDLGGGPGTYALSFCRANDEMTAIVFDLPTTKPFAEKVISSMGMDSRVKFVGGNFYSDDIPSGFDVVWISQILHSESTENCRKLIKRAMDSMKAGGTLYIQEFILNEEKSGPLFPALFSLNMLLATDGGQAYSGKEIMGMMKEAGFVNLQRLDIELPNGAGIISGQRL
ncbi:MAG: acetylserotonin O-methyltransferase [Desulfuromonadales bacterium]|nr:acetylserotonin O-methyltransferase [Desulfuromonadales bacterium]